MNFLDNKKKTVSTTNIEFVLAEMTKFANEYRAKEKAKIISESINGIVNKIFDEIDSEAIYEMAEKFDFDEMENFIKTSSLYEQIVYLAFIAMENRFMITDDFSHFLLFYIRQSDREEKHYIRLLTIICERKPHIGEIRQDEDMGNMIFRIVSPSLNYPSEAKIINVIDGEVTLVECDKNTLGFVEFPRNKLCPEKSTRSLPLEMFARIYFSKMPIRNPKRFNKIIM